MDTMMLYQKMYSEYPELLEVKDLCEILGYERKSLSAYQKHSAQKIPCSRKNKPAKAPVIAFVMQSAQKWPAD